MKILLFLAGLNAAISIGLGAYGWHSLGDTEAVRDIFMMGSQYQMWHALGMVGVAILLNAGGPRRTLLAVGGLFQLGIILFSGTLYAFGLLDVLLVAGAAPVGGAVLILGWLTLAWTGLRWKKAGI
ncbi:MAG: DUF423 domain-containing protein [Rhodospirillaceae bacterium]|nr:DUF423 domain-containing protein [Rhodospirillaceae bacterium]